LVFVLAVLFAAPVAAWVPVTDPPSRWPRDRIPVAWFLDRAGSDDLDIDTLEAEVRAAYDTWTNVDCCYMAFDYRGRTDDTADDSPGTNVISWFEDHWGFGGEALGVAMSSYEGEAIVEGDVYMNGVDYEWNTTGSGGMDVQSIVVHEVGHVVGLGDLYDEPWSECTMFGTYPGGTEQRSLEEDDMEGARFLYEQSCCECTVGESGPCATESCGGGVHECGEDCFWGECAVPSPGEEICDGYDNDCDGRTDEDVCGGCVPTSEVCDERDNDCDTAVDENRVCGPECTPLFDVELCNGNDDDCDGVIDDGCACDDGTPPRPCGLDEGRCTSGEQSCTDGAWGACAGAVLPRRELCDGEDNDCDGTTDGDVCGTAGGGEDDGCGCAVRSAARTATGAGAAVALLLAAALVSRKKGNHR
jgi:hypothetical protein